MSDNIFLHRILLSVAENTSNYLATLDVRASLSQGGKIDDAHLIVRNRFAPGARLDIDMAKDLSQLFLPQHGELIIVVSKETPIADLSLGINDVRVRIVQR